MTQILLSFEEVAKDKKAKELYAIGNDGKQYNASYSPKPYSFAPQGIVFFCIPSDVEVLGYIEKN